MNTNTHGVSDARNVVHYSGSVLNNMQHGKDNIGRRKYVEHLKKKYGCSASELREKHSEVLSYGIRIQVNLMAQEETKQREALHELQEI